MPFFCSSFPRGAQLIAAVSLTTAMLVPAAHAAAVPGQGTWETTLQGRDLDGDLSNGYEAYYDTVLNITWLAKADASGQALTWGQAINWTMALDVYGIRGWRLPTVKPVDGVGFNSDLGFDGTTDFGYNITSTQSEFSHLYYVTLGNQSFPDDSYEPRPEYGLTNTGPFSGLQSGTYWTGTLTSSLSLTWVYAFSYGAQSYYYNSENIRYNAWAVFDGDIAPVPEPQTYALALAGLVAALVAHRLRA